MESKKRKAFLELFLGALGASQIIWRQINNDSIAGTVIYDPIDPEERQDFIWHISEQDSPDEDVITLVKYLKENELLDGDKLAVPITGIEIANMDESIKEKTFDKLFTVSVNMVDEGKETDNYFIHQ